MNISRKIVLTGVVTLGVFALGSAGAAAVAQSLTIENRAGVAQGIAPVTTGTMSPSPTESPANDKSNGPTGTTTVAPAPPVNVDDSGSGRSGNDDGAEHGLGDGDTQGDGDSKSGDSKSGDTQSGDTGTGDVRQGTGVSGGTGSGSTSGSGSSGKSGSSGGGGNGGGSGDTGAHH
jgi:hypothetical protein